MRKTVLTTAFLSASILPALAMDLGCSPASKVTARAPVEQKEQQASKVTDEMKAEAVRTAAAEKAEDKKVQ